MPLFVPILRLLMLFLNVYDSYKTLKQPPSSSRNGGRPSVRALTQRKRDMKGCLAVWIVWMCLTMYERVIESLVSLFIPFYDEFKSLVFVFLILTRARGAEPIYLHVIRPFLKPYTSTLDGALEVMLMFGDFIFALTTYPIRLSFNWWQQKFGPAEALDTKVETEISANDNPLESSNTPSMAQQSISAQFQKKTNGSKQTERVSLSSLDGMHRRHIHGSQTSSKSSIDRTSEAAGPSSRDSEEATNTLQHEEVEEWRRYPAFPSAYPPTPLVTTTRHLPTNPAFSAHLQPTSEQEPEQDFRQSLLPPREPLNPSYAGDTSDKQHTFSFGIHPPSTLSTPSGAHSNFDTEDSLEYNDDDEDDFNITLRTPLNPMGSLRVQLPSRRFISPSSALSGISIPSRSSALTTLDMNSLRTNSDTESSPSSAIPSNETDSSSVIGRKRAHAPVLSSSPRVRQVRAHETSIPHRRYTRNIVQSTTTRKPSKPISATRRRAIILPADDDPDFVSTTTGTEEDIVVAEEVPHTGNYPPAEKRRKVSQPSHKGPASPARKSVVVRGLRQRPVRQTSPTQPRRLKSVVLPDKRTIATASKARTAPASNRKADHVRAQNITASASTSSDSLPLVPPKDK